MAHDPLQMQCLNYFLQKEILFEILSLIFAFETKLVKLQDFTEKIEKSKINLIS